MRSKPILILTLLRGWRHPRFPRAIEDRDGR
jgi:hypothetical protein